MTKPPTGQFLSQQILRVRKLLFRPVGLRSRASFFLTSRISKAAAMIFGAVVITVAATCRTIVSASSDAAGQGNRRVSCTNIAS
jgi:ABC-type enterochelin transport system permease subunit